MTSRRILFSVRQPVREFPAGCRLASGRYNLLTYTKAECKMITERLSAYTEDPDSVC